MITLSKNIIRERYNEKIMFLFEALEYTLQTFKVGKTIHEYGLEYLEYNNKTSFEDICAFLNGNTNRSIEEYYSYYILLDLFNKVNKKCDTNIEIEYISGNNEYDYLVTIDGFKIPVEHKYIKKNGNTDAGQCISNVKTEIYNGKIFDKIAFIIEHDENNVITNIRFESFVVQLVVTHQNKFTLNKRVIDKTNNIVKGRWQITPKQIQWHNGCNNIIEIHEKLKAIYNKTVKIAA